VTVEIVLLDYLVGGLVNNVINRGEKIRYVCLRCGECCSSGPNVALTVFDVCRIASYLGKPWRSLAGGYFYVVIADQIPVIVLRGVDDKCVFLRESSGKTYCEIYPARPMRCRLYPFIPIAPRERGKLEVSSNCPGINSGDYIEPPWSLLEEYQGEVFKHYSALFDLIFRLGYEPLKALESLLDKVCIGNSSV
jgi:Fe-S-cluster containining protein